MRQEDSKQIYAIMPVYMTNHGILLLSCPDRKGIVLAVAEFLYRHNANIIHADEHQDSELKLFFLRVEWDMTGFQLDKKDFAKTFASVAKKFSMQWRVCYTDDQQNIAIFVSKEDHCLADILYRQKSGELACNICCIISNHKSVKSLADFYGIPFYTILVDKQNKKTAENKALAILREKHIDMVILARYMQILSTQFIRQYENRIINIHHSFLPAFVGEKPYHQAYERGVKIIGATSHYVTADLDNGPIIEQDVIRISHRDTISDLIQKGRDLEKIVLSRAIKWHIENKILTYANKTVIFD